MLVVMIIVLVVVLINTLFILGMAGFLLRLADVLREIREQLPISVVPPSPPNRVDLDL